MEPPAFTGERYVPGQGGARIAYEHVHRYLFAARWAKGKQVLDIATGAGYGALLLSRIAQRVSAVDLDFDTVRFSRATFGSATLQFYQADAAHLPFQNSSMDLVVAFEILEHVSDQKGLVREIARVMRPDGFSLISTPDKATYTDARSYCNPYHVRELYREEFLELLRQHFKNVQLMSQQLRAGSLIVSPNGSNRDGEVIVGCPPGPQRAISPPLYLLALCGDEKTPEGAVSAYMDATDALFEEWRREIETLGQWGQELERTIRDRDESLRRALNEVELRDGRIESLEAVIAERDETIRGLQSEMKREISARDEALLQLRGEFDDRGRWAIQQDKKIRELMDHLERLERVFAYRVLRRIGILPK